MLVERAKEQGIREDSLPAPLLDCHECNRISLLFEKCSGCGESASKIYPNSRRDNFICKKCSTQWAGFICPYCDTKNSGVRAMRVFGLNFKFWHYYANDRDLLWRLWIITFIFIAIVATGSWF